MISNSRYWFLMVLIVLVYIAGMFVTLFENDSAQFAVMAMRMVQENDFLNLFKGTEEYLDKPHMHYWLAALSFKIFGLHDWAYRIPGILAILLGAYSAYGLGKLLYNKDSGRLAALIFMTAQTIVLAAIDVRTDAVLTGFGIFSIWQLAVYIDKKSLAAIILGAFGAGIAFSTKGQLALLTIGLAILSHLAYTRRWSVIFHWKVIVALAVFVLTITPMLYAYYHQFDLHPEKIIRGKSGRSGIFFIFWEQSFERMSGEGMGSNSSDFFFFFHTYLWVFLPWTILGIAAFGNRIRALYTTKFSYSKNKEALTLGGIALFFLIASFSQFKLPHYLNGTIPLFAVLTAGYLNELYITLQRKTLKVLMVIQYFVLSIVFIASLLLCYYVFTFEQPLIPMVLITLACIIGFFSLRHESFFMRLITISACCSILLNAVLNLHFYPHLLTFQAGSSMASVISEQNIPVENIYKVSNDHTWALDFYNQKPVQLTTFEEIRGQKKIWVYINNADLRKFQQLGLDWDIQYTRPQFRITRLSMNFLNPSTRKKTLDRVHLIRIH
ncbi:ArnT family glycosyltransferase [Pareuzebyella sediminis]|uniref:ArnT family glycosyltransferase n=1 Tax=Pareuzebyella sediminis TaxID=2607998 RepID=UPI0011ED0B3C|nr:glycosyltransferase family 39 protein [Pareuzebyella sediminis]